jgi:hypothetical protein
VRSVREHGSGDTLRDMRRDHWPCPTASPSADHRLEGKDGKMRQRSMLSRGTPTPIRPLRILIEDRHIDLSATPQHHAWAVDLTACDGPASETEECPLVMTGACPLGRFDVVVGALQGPWAKSVHAAWADTGTPYADARGIAVEDPTERVAHHIGAAIQTLYAPYHNGE